jgi:hypothetical protein
MIHSNLITDIAWLASDLPDSPDLSEGSGWDPPAESEPGSVDGDEDKTPTGPGQPWPFKRNTRYKMALNNLTQKQLDVSVDLLITNGPLPYVQEIIAPVGFGPEGLQRLADLLYGWRANQTGTVMKMLAQKQARQQRDELRRLIEQLVSSFTRTAKAIFKDEPNVLRALNLRLSWSSKKGSAGNGTTEIEANGNGTTETEANGNGTTEVEANGSGSTSGQKPKGAGSLTTCVTDARKLFTNALDLEEVHKQRLAEAGWDVDRLAEALEQVNTLVATDGKRREASIARRNQQTATMQTERELRDDYKKARELIRVAIDEADLDDEDEFKKLIGL